MCWGSCWFQRGISNNGKWLVLQEMNSTANILILFMYNFYICWEIHSYSIWKDWICIEFLMINFRHFVKLFQTKCANQPLHSPPTIFFFKLLNQEMVLIAKQYILNN
jgi:hypothetical protein